MPLSAAPGPAVQFGGGEAELFATGAHPVRHGQEELLELRLGQLLEVCAAELSRADAAHVVARLFQRRPARRRHGVQQDDELWQQGEFEVTERKGTG